MAPAELNRLIDHSLLSQTADESAVRALCIEARKFRFHAVCVNPVWVSFAREEMAGSDVQVCSVTGFPLGANKTEIKVSEAMLAVEHGATEIDMVANIGWCLSGQWAQAESEIRKLRRNLPDSVLLKVIIEAGRLSDDQIQWACQAVIEAGAEYVKSGTGYFGPVTVPQIERIVRAVSKRIKVKAAGGIRTPEFAHQLIAAGAARLGSSASPALLDIAE